MAAKWTHRLSGTVKDGLICAACGPISEPARKRRSDGTWRPVCPVGRREQRLDPSGAPRPRRPDAGDNVRGRHGLTRREARELREGKPCAICGRPSEVVDHEHATMRVRGVLCRSHNIALGLFDDDPALLRAAADYLER